MNDANIKNTGRFVVAGGNEEIIHLCEQNHSTFEGAYEAAIEFHRNDIFKYIYENKIEKINKLEELGEKCVRYYNYEILLFLEKMGMKINNNIINESATNGNIYLVKYFLQTNRIPKNLLISSTKSENLELFKYLLKQKEIDINTRYGEDTPLIWACKTGNIKLVKILLAQEGIDVDTKDSVCFGKSAYEYAYSNGHTEIVKLLRAKGSVTINWLYGSENDKDYTTFLPNYTLISDEQLENENKFQFYDVNENKNSDIIKNDLATQTNNVSGKTKLKLLFSK